MLMIQMLVGTILGSFLFASYSRWLVSGSIWRPARSQCDSCFATIPWFDLVPIFSYLLLHGRCRRCNSPIPVTAFCSELFFGGLLFCWQPTFESSCYLVAGVLLFFMAINDSKTMTFPVYYEYGLMGCAATAYLLTHPVNLTFFCLLLMWVILQLIEPKFPWIGSGDLDVFICFIILLGLTSFAWLILLSSSLALVTSFIFKRRKLPFIPFIALGYLAILFFI